MPKEIVESAFYMFSSKDILSRWTFPLVPDDNHPGGHIYEHTRGNRYIAKDNSVILARSVHYSTTKYDWLIPIIQEHVTSALTLSLAHRLKSPKTSKLLHQS